MDLIIGGAYQGKLTWAVAQYGLEQGELLDLAVESPRAARCWYHLEELTWRQVQAEKDASALLARLGPDLPEVVISREIGSGVVPMDPKERAGRELHGKVLRALAERSHRVIRVFCGLAEVLE